MAEVVEAQVPQAAKPSGAGEVGQSLKVCFLRPFPGLQLLDPTPEPFQQFGKGGALAKRLATGALLVQLGFAATHPFGGQLAAIEGFRLGVDAFALPVGAYLDRVP